MNWIYNHKRALLHVNLAFIGGLTGAYAILVRGGNFGAAQTMNLIEMVLNFTEMNLTDAFLRLAIFILYGLAIIAAFLIGEHFWPGFPDPPQFAIVKCHPVERTTQHLGHFDYWPETWTRKDQ